MTLTTQRNLIVLSGILAGVAVTIVAIAVPDMIAGIRHITANLRRRPVHE
jgi:hypothetical protein